MRGRAVRRRSRLRLLAGLVRLGVPLEVEYLAGFRIRNGDCTYLAMIPDQG